MTHIGQKGCFGFACLFRVQKRLRQQFALLQRPPGFGIHVREAGAYSMDRMVIPVLRVPDTGEADDLVGLPPVSGHHICVGDDALLLQSFLDCFRLNEFQKFFPVLIRNVPVRVVRHRFEILESVTDPEAVIDVRVSLVADAVIRIKLQVINAPVVRGEGGDHLALLRSSRLFRQELLLQFDLLFQHLPGRLLLLDLVVDVLETADDAHPAVWHIDLRELDAEITLAPVIHRTQIIDVELRLFLKPPDNVFHRQLLVKSVAVGRCNRCVYIIVLCLGVFHLLKGAFDGIRMG